MVCVIVGNADMELDKTSNYDGGSFLFISNSLYTKYLIDSTSGPYYSPMSMCLNYNTQYWKRLRHLMFTDYMPTLEVQPFSLLKMSIRSVLSATK